MSYQKGRYLDPDMYYGLVVANFPVLFPDASNVKKEDTIVHKEIREDVDGHQADGERA